MTAPDIHNSTKEEALTMFNKPGAVWPTATSVANAAF